MANILIADDSVIMRKNLKNILIQAGHTIVGEASNGLQAYSEFEKLNPDLVTMDITMPIMDGIESTDKIMKAFPQARIVMISALDQKNMVFKALEKGAKHYIIKPIIPDKVLTVINEVLMYDRLEDYSKELGSEKEALNNMWVEIKESKNEIIDLNKNMEQLVEERTKELEEANRKLKSTLENLQIAQEKLIQSEKSSALTMLVAGMAHEINTPIGICITAVTYLDEKLKELEGLYRSSLMKKSDFEDYISLSSETTKAAIINLNKASDLVRSFKQVAVDQSIEEKRQFNLKDYISDVILSLKPELKKKPHQLNIICDNNIEIKSYPGDFAQIITNLTMNTLIHGFDEGKELIININVTKSQNNLLLEFVDNGRGITSENLKKIFDPFFTTKRSSGGTGLGLNVVYNIVTQKLGGTIKCESEVGLGTAFIIYVPLNE